jgi:hypothetical protein
MFSPLLHHLFFSVSLTSFLFFSFFFFFFSLQELEKQPAQWKYSNRAWVDGCPGIPVISFNQSVHQEEKKNDLFLFPISFFRFLCHFPSALIDNEFSGTIPSQLGQISTLVSL